MALTFFCDGCKNNRNFDLEYGIAIATEKEIKRICRLCRRPKGFVPDVYFDGKPEEGLADDPLTGKARTFSSAREKAKYLKERNLHEAGDSVHGAPPQFSRQEPPRLDSRHETMMALKKVKEMGSDVRRQEINRIIKERQRLGIH